MELFDPRKPNALAHAGTFNNNVLTMAAGRAGLEQVFTPERAAELHAVGERLRADLNDIGSGTLMKVTGVGSIMCFHFTTTPASAIKSHLGLKDVDATLAGLFHLFLLERGYYIARRGFLALNLALSDQDYAGFLAAVKVFVDEHRSLLTESRARL